MSDTTIVILCSIIGLSIWSWILYEMVYASTYGRKIWTEERKQTKILLEMAKKSGVHESTLTEITDEKQYKFRGW